MNAVVTSALDAVLAHPGIWRRSSAAQSHVRALATGLPELDALLPGGGWPSGALSEILIDADGLGELSLLMPALADITQRGQRVVFVAPPYIPYAPALEAHGLDLRHVVQIQANANEGAWSAEQCLRSGSCGAVLSWLDEADYTQLRRLQLAAESGDALAFLFRPARAASKHSPAALRLQLHTDQSDESVRAEPFDYAQGRLRSRSERSRSDPRPSTSASSEAYAQDEREFHFAAPKIDIEILKCRGNLDRRRPTRLRWRA